MVAKGVGSFLLFKPKLDSHHRLKTISAIKDPHAIRLGCAILTFPFHVIQFINDDMSLVIVRFSASSAVSYIDSIPAPGVTS